MSYPDFSVSASTSPSESLWTTMPPNQDGLYWARRLDLITPQKCFEKVELVLVLQDDDPAFEVWTFGSDCGANISEWTHWKGPLPAETSPVPVHETAHASAALIEAFAQEQERIRFTTPP